MSDGKIEKTDKYNGLQYPCPTRRPVLFVDSEKMFGTAISPLFLLAEVLLGPSEVFIGPLRHSEPPSSPLSVSENRKAGLTNVRSRLMPEKKRLPCENPQQVE